MASGWMPRIDSALCRRFANVAVCIIRAGSSDSGDTTIDFVLRDKEVREKIEDMRIGDRIDLDHHPVEVKVKGRERERERERERGEERRGKERRGER